MSLFGCGKDSDDDFLNYSGSVSDQTLYYAQDVVRQSSSSGNMYIDLSMNMGSNDGTNVALSQVISLNPSSDCDILSLNSNGVTIKGDRVQVCDYIYRVGPAISPQSTGVTNSNYAEATLRTITAVSSELLTPISALTSAGDSLVINIKEALAGTGYTIDDKFSLSYTVSLPLVSTTGSAAVSNPIDDTILYIPGTGIPSGIERVLYSYVDDDGNVLAGTIDIAVSTASNTAPVARSIKLSEFTEVDSGKISNTVPWNKKVEIDVANLISDPDGDQLQLIDVFVFGATVSILLPADGEAPFSGTKFHFQSTESGTKNISYTVSDLKGGYATGVIEVEIDGPYSAIGIFSAPHTAKQAEEFSALFKPQGPGDGSTALENLLNASYDFERAEAVCLTQGRHLPSVSQLVELYNNYPIGGLFKVKNWPIDLPYWSVEGNLVHMAIGIAVTGAEYAYVSCVPDSQKVLKKVELNNSAEMNEPFIVGVPKIPELLLTYEDGSTTVIQGGDNYFYPQNYVQVVGNEITALRAGNFVMYIYYEGLFVDFIIKAVDPVYEKVVVDLELINRSELEEPTLVGQSKIPHLLVTYDDGSTDIVFRGERYVYDESFVKVTGNEIAPITAGSDWVYIYVGDVFVKYLLEAVKAGVVLIIEQPPYIYVGMKLEVTFGYYDGKDFVVMTPDNIVTAPYGIFEISKENGKHYITAMESGKALVIAYITLDGKQYGTFSEYLTVH